MSEPLFEQRGHAFAGKRAPRRGRASFVTCHMVLGLLGAACSHERTRPSAAQTLSPGSEATIHDAEPPVQVVAEPPVQIPDAAAGTGPADATLTPEIAPDGSAEDSSTHTACTRCTGPGDWSPGDYPPKLHEQDYLPITGVSGQGSAVRGYKVHVPKSYRPDHPAPVVFALHGLGQNPVLYAVDGAGWPDKSDAEGFILIMPTGNAQNSDGSWGMTGSWNAGECCGNAASAGVDDVALIRAIFAEVGKHVNLDLTRVYASGLSNGGFLSYRLACEAADLFVAIAPGAGAIGTPDIGPENVGNADFKVCHPAQPVSVLDMHGTADPLVPYAFAKPSLDHMAAADGCGTSTAPASIPQSGGDTTCVTYTGCPSGVEVTGCSVEGGGHCWFGNDSCGTGAGGLGNAIVGANSNFLNDTDAAWAFLSRLSRP